MTATKTKSQKTQETEKVGSVVVKIYKRTRRTVTGGTCTVWEIAAYTQGARRVLGFKDNVAALAEAKRRVEVISAGNAAGADLTNREAANLGRALELIRPTRALTELGRRPPCQCVQDS